MEAGKEKEKKMLKKEVAERGKEKFYLLGKDEKGTKHWLVSPSWDCDWYWGFGYVQTMQGNRNPLIARDIDSHQHFNSLVLEPRGTYHINNVLEETTLTDSEAWKLSDLMKSFYTLKEAGEVFYRGNSHYTTVEGFSLKNHGMYEEINKELLPKIFAEVEKLLSPKEEQEQGIA